MDTGKVRFWSSIEQLNRGFEWARNQALFYVHDDVEGAGKWYEAALPGRNAFCMRDVAHQAEGAATLGLWEHTKNMLELFARSISESRDYCGFWEITGEGKPCPADYVDDTDFWYNLPGSFEVIWASYCQYLWTGDRDYLENPVFTKYYTQTCEELVRLWDKDGDGIPEHYPEQGRRGIATYNEKDIGIKAGADLLAAQYAAYKGLARMHALTGKMEEAGSYRRLGEELKQKYMKEWHRSEEGGFYGAVMQDGSFYQEYDEEGNFLPLRFGILDGEREMQEAIKQVKAHEPANVEGRSYYPQIFYHCGEREEGLRYLLSLCNPKLERREYPEVSFAVVGTVVNWVMGIRPDEEGRIVTCSALPEGQWAGLEELPVQGTVLNVFHQGMRETKLHNTGSAGILWKAEFPGYHEKAVCRGGEQVILCSHEKNAAGEEVSFVIIPVEAGGEERVWVLDCSETKK